MRLHNRQIKAGYWNDQDLIKWPLAKRVLFQGLWCIADDSGCCLDDSWAIKVLVFPSPVDAEITPAVIESYLNEIEQENKIIRYKSENKDCFFITNFHKYQRLDNPAAPEVPLPEWITFEQYPSNKRAGKYIVSNPSDTITLQSPYDPLTESLQTSSNLEPRTMNHEPEEDIFSESCGNGFTQQVNCGDATEPDQQEKNNVVPLSEPKGKRKSKTVSEDAKEVSKYLQDGLKANGVNHFPRDWLLKNYSTADRLLSTIPKTDLIGCINWAMSNPYWSQKISDLLGIERAYMQWVREKNPTRKEDDDADRYKRDDYTG